jgi:hypothetical protein
MDTLVTASTSEKKLHDCVVKRRHWPVIIRVVVVLALVPQPLVEVNDVLVGVKLAEPAHKHVEGTSGPHVELGQLSIGSVLVVLLEDLNLVLDFGLTQNLRERFSYLLFHLLCFALPSLLADFVLHRLLGILVA